MQVKLVKWKILELFSPVVFIIMEVLSCHGPDEFNVGLRFERYFSHHRALIMVDEALFMCTKV